jgi:cyclopropane-fatty-acyl-phospholipid synthase
LAFSDRILIALLRDFVQVGTLKLMFANGRMEQFGSGDPKVSLTFLSPRLSFKILRSPEMALGEAYMNQEMAVGDDDIVGLQQLLIRNANLGRVPKWQQSLSRVRIRWQRFRQRASVAATRRRVVHHYEISTDFYRLFLDASMQYTCAYFLGPDDSLEQAQKAKALHIAKKLLLNPGQRVLDIGCGWGELACVLARDFGVHVTGITLSAQQQEYAIKRSQDYGVADRVDFRVQDYRQVSESFDRIVSVGMLEHVGFQQFQAYFKQIESNLTEDGIALIHFIGRSSEPSGLQPWFDTYIFPGGYTPALSEIYASIEPTKLMPTDMEVWRTHYPRTLHEWRLRFEANLPQVRKLYDERFIRMWRYYLSTAEVSLAEMSNDVYQIQLTKRKEVVPVTRDYLYPC